MKLPDTVVALDYGSKGDLYVRFEHAEQPMGEASKDGRVVFFYGVRRRLVAVEILDLNHHQTPKARARSASD
jgi:hypothetical protein